MGVRCARRYPHPCERIRRTENGRPCPAERRRPCSRRLGRAARHPRSTPRHAATPKKTPPPRPSPTPPAPIICVAPAAVVGKFYSPIRGRPPPSHAPYPTPQPQKAPPLNRGTDFSLCSVLFSASPRLTLRLCVILFPLLCALCVLRAICVNVFSLPFLLRNFRLSTVDCRLRFLLTQSTSPNTPSPLVHPPSASPPKSPAQSSPHPHTSSPSTAQ